MEWYQDLDLRQCGVYCEGFIEDKKLNGCLEKHGKETASTFGTRKSSREKVNMHLPLYIFSRGWGGRLVRMKIPPHWWGI